MNMETRFRAFFCLLACMPSISVGEARTDGTMGAVRELSGKFKVPQDLGTLKGQNLFHSFQSFHVRAGESATFTGQNSIKNVISRVTGDEASEINGKLRSKVGKADFYFINPNGVTIGENAKIDVPAAFKASTASEIRFPDGAVFSAANPAASSLSLEEPEAYGFLGNQKGEIALRMAQLNAKPNRSVELVGREIAVQDSTLTVPGGAVRLEAVGVGNVAAPVEGASEAGHGAMNIRSSSIDVSGNGGGKLRILGGDANVEGSTLFAKNTGKKNAVHDSGIDIKSDRLSVISYLRDGAATPSQIRTNNESSGSGGDIDIVVMDRFQVSDSTIRAAVVSGASGRGGNIKIKAKILSVDRPNQLGTTINTSALSGATGDAGTVTIDVDEYMMLDGGALDDVINLVIGSATFGKGDSGSVKIYSRGDVLIKNSSLRTDTDIDEDTREIPDGKGGKLTIEAAGNIGLWEASTIRTDTKGSGNAGNIEVKAKNLTLDGVSFGGKAYGSYISSASLSGNGNAGSIKVFANNIKLSYFSFITSTAENTKGAAGSVFVSAAGDITLKESGRIDADVDDKQAPDGKGGIVTILAGGDLSLAANSKIRTNSFGKAGAGVINVAVERLLMDDSYISSAPAVEGTDAGKIMIHANGLIDLKNGSYIRTDARGGAVSGIIEVVSNGDILASNSEIRSNIFSGGLGGDIVMDAENIVLDASTVTTSASSPGAGRFQAGSISMKADTAITVKNLGGVLATASDNAEAGQITVHGGKLLSLQNGNITSDTKGIGNAGNIKVDMRGGDVEFSTGGFVSSSTNGTGDAGQVSFLNVNTMTIQGGKDNQMVSGIRTTADLGSTGKAGDIGVTADRISITQAGSIRAENADGGGGKIDLSVKHLALSQGGTVSTSTQGAGTAGDILIHDAEDVSIDGVADAVISTLPDGRVVQGRSSGIYLQTQGTGNGGSLDLNTDRLTLSDGGLITAVSAYGGTADTRGGNLDLHVRTAELSGGGLISASTSGAGQAGSITLTAEESFAIAGQFDRGRHASVTTPRISDHSGITSSATRALDPNAQSLGAGGTVTLYAPSLILTDGGEIGVSTEGSQRAGDININAAHLSLDGAGIASEARSGSTGNAGSIHITADQSLTLANGGQINSDTAGSGNAGNIQIDVQGGDLSLSSGGTISSSTNGSGDAGQIALLQVHDLSIDGQNDANHLTGISTTATPGSTGQAGGIGITADRISIGQAGSILAENADGAGGRIDLSVKHLALGTGGTVSTSTQGAGTAGDILIHDAEDVSIDGVADTVISTLPDGRAVQGLSSGIYLETLDTGNGGSLDLNADRLTLSDGGLITAVSAYGGTADTRGGNLDLHVRTAELSGGGLISASTSGAGQAGSITLTADASLAIAGQFDRGRHAGVTSPRISDHSGISSSATRALDPNAPTLGAGGTVTLHAPSLTLTDGGEISVSTEGLQRAGDVHINAAHLTIDGASITSEARTGSTGNAGNVTVTATDRLHVAQGGNISSDTFGSGAGGTVNVAAGRMNLNGTGAKTGITAISSAAAAGSGGQAGAVTVRVNGDLSITDGAAISSRSAGSGNAGSVAVAAANLRLDGEGRNTEITSGTEKSSSGNAGSVRVEASGNMRLSGQGLITSSARGSGNAGSVRVRAGVLGMNQARIATQAREGQGGKIAIHSDQALRLADAEITTSVSGRGNAGTVNITAAGVRMLRSSIATQARDGNGGAISLQGGSLLRLIDSEITTSVQGTTNGNGGDIDIGGEYLILKTGFIQANTVAPQARGGDIRVRTQGIVPSGGTLQVGGNQPLQPERGRFGYNVIQAAAPDGVSGSIDLGGVQLGLSGAIATLAGAPIDLSSLVQDYCNLNTGSSLLSAGQGALPLEAGLDPLTP